MSLELIPGNPGVIRREAARYRSAASAMLDAAAQLRSLESTSGLKGEAAKAIAEKAQKISDDIRLAVTKFSVMASALETYGPKLEAAQNKAYAAATEYAEHSELARIASGQQEFNAAQALIEGISDPQQAMEDARRFAARFEEEMSLAVTAGRAHAEALAEVHIAAAEAVASLAVAGAISFTGLLTDMVKSAWEFLADHWDDFQRFFLDVLDNFQKILEALMPLISLIGLILSFAIALGVNVIPGVGQVASAMIISGILLAISTVNVASLVVLNQEFEGEKRRSDSEVTAAAISLGVEFVTLGATKGLSRLLPAGSILVKDINLFAKASPNLNPVVGVEVSNIVIRRLVMNPLDAVIDESISAISNPTSYSVAEGVENIGKSFFEVSPGEVLVVDVGANNMDESYRFSPASV